MRSFLRSFVWIFILAVAPCLFFGCTTNKNSGSTATYTVGGTISGLTSSGLVLQDNGADNLTVASGSTSFTFATAVASGKAYAVTVSSQPTGENCVVASGTGTVGNAAVTNVAITCATTYKIGGTVSGLVGSGLVLQDNGKDNLAVTGDGVFTFATPIAAGSGYAVTVATQPSNPSQNCVVASGSGTVGNAAVTNVAVTCTTSTFTIGGTISGLTSAGLVLQDNAGDNLSVASGNTSFTFATAVASGQTYAVTVQSQPMNPAETCVVASGSGTVGAGPITSVQITCALTKLTIGGSVINLTTPVASGVVLHNALPGGGTDSVTVSANGTFSFPTSVLAGSSYTVTVAAQPTSPNQTCTVETTTGTGTAENADVTTVIVNCGHGEWAWMTGPSPFQPNQPSTGSMPGARQYPASWTNTTSGTLWLFGGSGYGANSAYGELNDLWSYSIASGQWSLVNGSANAGAAANYAPPAALNPGSRDSSSTWIDSSGNLWLFGGETNTGSTSPSLNDLWEYNVASGQWVSPSGAVAFNAPGSYPASRGLTGTPGARTYASTWTDQNGNLWLFGGNGYDGTAAPNTGYGALNDLWEYNTTANTWTWVSGSDSVSTATGTYNTVGSAGVPPGRYGAFTWVDQAGNLWMFGGTSDGFNSFNDLWEYKIASAQWIWQGGPNTQNGFGVYSSSTQPLIPGARNLGFAWTDPAGKFWLFGGVGYDSAGNFWYLNDLWQLDPATLKWTWVNGLSVADESTSTAPEASNYPPLGSSTTTSNPGERLGGAAWTDSSGSLWLFGGQGGSTGANMNDLWLYLP